MRVTACWIVVSIALLACSSSDSKAPPKSGTVTTESLPAALEKVRDDVEDVVVLASELEPIVGPPSAMASARDERLVFTYVVWAIANDETCDVLTVIHVRTPPQKRVDKKEEIPRYRSPTQVYLDYEDALRAYDRQLARDRARAAAEPEPDIDGEALETVGGIERFEAGMPWFAECRDWARGTPTGLGQPDYYANGERFDAVTAPENALRVDAAHQLFGEAEEGYRREEVAPLLGYHWLTERLGTSATDATGRPVWAVSSETACVSLTLSLDGTKVEVAEVTPPDRGWEGCAALAAARLAQ